MVPLCTFFQDISPDELREELPAHQPRYPFHVGTHMGKKSQHILLSISGFSNLASTQRKSSTTSSIMRQVLVVFQISPVKSQSDLSELMKLICF